MIDVDNAEKSIRDVIQRLNEHRCDCEFAGDCFVCQTPGCPLHDLCVRSPEMIRLANGQTVTNPEGQPVELADMLPLWEQLRGRSCDEVDRRYASPAGQSDSNRRPRPGPIQLLKGAAAIAQSALGIGEATRDIAAERWRICQACDRFDMGTCGACSCCLPAKVWLRNQRCPLPEPLWTEST